MTTEEETTMTTKTETNPPTAWAEAAGRRLAERRAERLAEQQRAEEAAATGRALSLAELAQRFADVAVVVVAALDAFATAAMIRIESDPVAVGSLHLSAGANRLRMVREDDRLTAEFRGRSRAETRSWDLALEPFAPDEVGREIAQQWITQLGAEEGLHHVVTTS
jgi:hypothetical protein